MKNRIYFKKFVSEDDFQYFLKLVSNEEVMVMDYGRVFELEESKKLYEQMLKRSRKHKDFGDFKVFEKATNTFIGSKKILLNNGFASCKIFETDDGSLAEMFSKKIIHTVGTK